MSDSDQLPAFSGLTEDEALYVYNVEVLQLPVKKAAQLAGMSLVKINKPHIMQARDLAKRELRGNLQITKEDVVNGMHDAIGRARILAEPMTEIIGWEKIAKLLGFDQPVKIDINISQTVEALQKNVRNLDDAALVKALGADNIIDAEFYEIQGNRKAG
jgi:hypothetical protein